MNNKNKDLNHPSRFAELKENEKLLLLAWIKKNIQPQTHWNYNNSSYGMKHLFEVDTGIYVCNGAFKGAMAESGFEAVDEWETNWHYRATPWR